tara:strand:- start:7261 stop:13638 length:6378 start_codon:yes stop_codon:yes gene_type:complete
MALKGGRHYVVIPTLIDIEATSLFPAASTSVYCPYRTLPDHVGFSEIGYNGSQYFGTKSLFKEIVGIVPTKLWDYHTNAFITLSEANLSTYINKIKYNYLVDGHKVITIVYNQAAFNNVFKEIEFKILFDDGEYHTVKQAIVHSECMNEFGVEVDYSNLFTFDASASPVYAPTDRSANNMGNIRVLSNSKKIIFDTYAYSDKKFDTPEYLNNNSNFFQVAYHNQDLFPAASKNITINIPGTGNVFFTNDKCLWEFRQSSRAIYNANSSSGISRGTLEKDINPLGDISFIPTNMSANGTHSNNGYRDLRFISSNYTPLNSQFIFSNLGGDFISDQAPDAMQTQFDNNNANNQMAGVLRGFAATSNDTINANSCNAFYLPNTASERSTGDTSRTFDGVIFSVSNWNGNIDTDSNGTIEDGMDTGNEVLKSLATSLVFGGNSYNWPSDRVSPNTIARWKFSDTNDSAHSLLLLNLISPQDFISNYILGRHAKYLSRPHHLGADLDLEHNKLQASLTASIFRKNIHPEFNQYTESIPPGQLQLSNQGLQVNKNDQGGKRIVAIPYHYYVDAYQPITLGLGLGGIFLQNQVAQVDELYKPYLFGSVGFGSSVLPAENGNSTVYLNSSTTDSTFVAEYSFKTSNNFTAVNIFTAAFQYDNLSSKVSPSADRNSVWYSQTHIAEPLGLSIGTANLLNEPSAQGSVIANSIYNNSVNDLTLAFNGTHEDIRSVVTQTGINVLLDGDVRKVYSRGCLNMDRGRSVSDPLGFELDLLITPALTNTNIAVTELQFKSVYGVGQTNVLTSQVLPSLVNATVIDCGCEGIINNIQWDVAGGAGAATVADNALDIFRIKYTPGRNSLDNSLFPINTLDFSQNTSVTVSDTDSDHRVLTVNLSGDDPSDLDRPLVDVEVGNFNWDNTSNYISTIEIAGRENAVLQIGSEDDSPGLNDLNFSPQLFQFVALGNILVEGGGVEVDVPGCTDPTASNYNRLATVDDGTCISCDLTGTTGWANLLNYPALSITTIFPQPSITAASQPFGMADWYADATYQNGTWVAGQKGNAHNFWGPNLTAALTDSGGTAVPYGDDFGDDANPYTFFMFKSAVTPDFLNASTNGAFGALLTSLIANNNFTPAAWNLVFYNIEDWEGTDSAQWNTQYDVSPDVSAEQAIPILNFATNPGIGSMQNQSTNPLLPTFASFTANQYPGSDNLYGWDPNSATFLEDPNVQSFLKPGKHYVALLVLSIADMVGGYVDPETNVSIDCNKTVAVPFNFWVTFCGCDIFNAENYVGDLFTYPWSSGGENSTPFPAGYTNNEICTTSAGSKKIKQFVDDPSGFCIIPDPFSCDNFLDACIESITPECIPSGELGVNIFSGTINVSVYGAFTGFEFDQYAFIIGGELLQFELYLLEGEYTEGQSLVAEEGFYYNFASVEDYQAFGFDPAFNNQLLLSFTNLPQGTYTAVLVQTNTFSFQENPCPPLVLTLTTLVLSGGGDCPDDVVGCTDTDAINYDPNATLGCPNNDCCEYVDCEDLFIDGQINTISTTNTILDCVSTELEGSDPVVNVNILVDQSIGSFTITNYDEVSLNDFATGTFVAAYCQVFGGNSGTAVSNILDMFQGPQNADILDTTRESTLAIIAGDTTIGGFLPFVDGLPVLTSSGFVTPGLNTGYYAVMLIPGFTDVVGDDCTIQIINNFDSLSFFSIGSTLNFDDCPTPCNDQTNPEDCPDAVPGCMDENATNYNQDCAGNTVVATYDDGCCNNEGQGECDQNAEADGCEDCTDDVSSGLPGLRDCDEANDSTEGCCDPSACNFDPTVDVCILSRCEYCCAEDDDCEDGPTTDECEDENGNILPDCVQPECPDPTNPECDTPVVDPCPANVDCPGPPSPECVILGNCPEDGEGGDDDEDVIIDDEVIEEVVCQPALGNYETFDEVRSAAMTCSASEGSKLLFKLRSGVKYDKTDLIKLTLINYLFNFAINETCMATCNETDDARAKQLGVHKASCKDRWIAGGRQIWTPTSTYGKGAVVGVLRLEAGKNRLEYFKTVAPIGSGDAHPKTKLSKTASAKWAPCITTRGKGFNETGQIPYVNTFYEFMTKFCEQCSVYTGSSTSDEYTETLIRTPQSDGASSGIVDENGNEIKLF